MNKSDVFVRNLGIMQGQRRFQVALGVLAVLWVLAAGAWVQRATSAAFMLESKLTDFRHVLPPRPPASVASRPPAPITAVDPAGASQFLPNLAAIAARNAVTVLSIELGQNQSAGFISGDVIRLTLQGAYLNSRTALAELLAAAPDLLVEHVSWQRAATGTDVESHVTLLNSAQSTDGAVPQAGVAR